MVRHANAKLIDVCERSVPGRSSVLVGRYRPRRDSDDRCSRVAILAAQSFGIRAFAGWMIASVCGGFGLRWKLFFANQLSLHKAFSFDALFQAAILVNPQTRYPDVEREFLACQINTGPDSVSPWLSFVKPRPLQYPSFLQPLSLL